jgi:hypothetical protein
MSCELRYGILVLWLLWQSLMGSVYVSVWHDDLSLWRYAAMVSPRNVHVLDNLDKAEYAAGNLEGARR